MKKYYCDICGKELGEKEVIKLAPMGFDFRNYLKVSRDVKEIGLEFDSCESCLPEFYETLKMALKTKSQRLAATSIGNN